MKRSRLGSGSNCQTARITATNQMRGSLKQRSKGSWSIILDLGRETDPVTGGSKHKQKWITFRGTKAQAEAQLTAVLSAADGGTFVEPSKVTLIAWLRAWLEKSVKPLRRPQTYQTYESIIRTHVAESRIALIPLQKLRAPDLERFYADLPLAPKSVSVLHAAIHRALKKAVKDRLLTVNPAVDLERRRPDTDPRPRRRSSIAGPPWRRGASSRRRRRVRRSWRRSCSWRSTRGHGSPSCTA